MIYEPEGLPNSGRGPEDYFAPVEKSKPQASPQKCQQFQMVKMVHWLQQASIMWCRIACIYIFSIAFSSVEARNGDFHQGVRCRHFVGNLNGTLQSTWDDEVERAESQASRPVDTTKQLRRDEKLPYVNSRAALRKFLRENRGQVDEIYFHELRRGKSVEGLTSQEAYGILRALEEDLLFREIRMAQERGFGGYYDAYSTYEFRYDWERQRRFDIGLHHSRQLPLPADQEALFLDNSFTNPEELEKLYKYMPSWRLREQDATMLPAVASENRSISIGGHNNQSVLMYLSSKFMEPLSPVEMQSLTGIRAEFEQMGVGTSLRRPLEETTDHRIVAEAVLAASRSKEGRGILLTRDELFIVPLWNAARNIQIPFERQSYSFRMFAEYQEVDGVRIPVVRIVTERPVKSELIVVHPYMRPALSGRSITHVMRISPR